MNNRSQRKGDPFYLTPEWKALRLERIRLDRYICQHCGVKCLGKAKGMPAPQVDHVKPRRLCPSMAMDIDNLRTLCHSCHSKRTKADQLDRPPIGLDGYPIEATL